MVTPKRTSTIIGLLALAVLAAAVGGWYFSKAPHFLLFPDSMEYAMVARSISQGEGAATQCLWVLRLLFTTDLPAAEVRRPLLLPYWTALWFKVFGVRDAVAIFAGGFWWIVLIVLTYWLCLRVTAHPTAAFVAGALLILDSVTLKLAFCGLTEPLFAVLFLGVAWTLYKAEKPSHFLISGLLLGLAQWTRTNAFLYIVPALLFIPDKDRQSTLVRALCLIGGFALLAFPIACRNQIVFGSFSLNPLYSYVALNGTPIKPEHGMERSLDLISPLRYFISNPVVLIRKWTDGFDRNFQILGKAIYPVCIGTCLVAIGFYKDKRKRNLVLFALLSLFLSMVLFAIGEFEGIRFYAPFAPVLFVMVADLIFESGIVSSRRMQKILAFSLVAVSLPVTVNAILLTDSQDSTRVYLDSLEQEIDQSLSPEALVVSDVPWSVAWRAERTSVWLPYHPEELRVLAKYLPISAVVLSPTVMTSPELAPEWAQIYRTRRLPGFRDASVSSPTVILVKE